MDRDPIPVLIIIVYAISGILKMRSNLKNSRRPAGRRAAALSASG